MLIDDRRSGVSLPEVPLLAVLPGTGGLTRLTDKRRVRRDRADVFCYHRGRRARPPRARVAAGGRSGAAVGVGGEAARARAGTGRASDRPADARGIALTPLERSFADDGRARIRMCVSRSTAPRAGRRSRCCGPRGLARATLPASTRPARRSGRCALARELDDAILHLRLTSRTLGLLVLRIRGRSARGAGGRCAAGDARGRLAGAGDPPVVEARAEARST